MAYLPEVATVLKLAFEHEGWTYGFDAGTGTLDAGFDLDSRIGQTPLYIHLLEDVVLCHAYAPFKVAEEDRRRVMEFVTRANCGLKLGNFEMDLDTGVVCFKTTFCLTGVPLPTRAGPMKDRHGRQESGRSRLRSGANMRPDCWPKRRRTSGINPPP